MSQQVGPSLPEKKSCIFYKLMVASILQEKKLRIPHKFVKKFGDELSSIATLIVPSNRHWLVQLRKDNTRMWFDCGWNVFVEYYSISIGCFLVFRYEGNSCFNVHVYDLKASEMNYLPDVINNSQEPDQDKHAKNDKGIQFSEVEVEITSAADEGGSDFLNETQKNIKKSKRETELNMNEHESLGKGEVNEELRDTRAPRYVPRRQREVTREEKQNALRAALMFNPGNPFCRILMQPSYVYNGLLLHVPRFFARRYLNGVEGTISLQVPEGKKWPVRCVFARGSLKFSKGWAEFVLDNKLDEGDVCVFELINTLEIVLEVTIFRVLDVAIQN